MRKGNGKELVWFTWGLLSNSTYGEVGFFCYVEYDDSQVLGGNSRSHCDTTGNKVRKIMDAVVETECWKPVFDRLDS